jgi:hypothetical protein
VTTRTWLRKLFASRTPCAIRKAPDRYRLSLDALEERALLSINFYPVNTVLLNAVGPSSLALGHFRGPAAGPLDLVTTDASLSGSTFSDFGGLSNGSFTVDETNATQGRWLSSAALGDFNGDGWLDLVTANSGTNNVSVVLNTRNSLAPFDATDVTYAVGTKPTSVAVGDFNGDGKLDLVTANSGSNTVSILLGNGDGTFQSAVSYGVGTAPSSVAAGDFNGDGKLDLVTANSGSNNVSVLRCLS